MAVKFTGKFTKIFLDNPADGTHTDGTGLYLAVRNGGKARSWSFRYRGKRKTIGSAFRISLEKAQDELQQFKAELKAGKDPMAPTSNANVWTFAEEADLFKADKSKEEWGDDAQKLGQSMINTYIKNTTYAKVPLPDIDVGAMYDILKLTWNTTPVFAKRAALMIGQMISLAQIGDPPRYPADKKNPVDLTKLGLLRKKLGKQRLGGHRLGLPPESIPKLVAHLYEPLCAHGPDECTTAEAAEAIGCDPQAIMHAWRRGKLKNRRKLGVPYDHRNAPSVCPIAELKKHFHFRKEPRQHAEVGPHAYVLLFLIYTAVRPDMGCGLLWTEVNWVRGIIDFGKRHKMAARDPEADYTIPITPEVKALLLTMKETATARWHGHAVCVRARLDADRGKSLPRPPREEEHGQHLLQTLSGPARPSQRRDRSEEDAERARLPQHLPGMGLRSQRSRTIQAGIHRGSTRPQAENQQSDVLPQRHLSPASPRDDERVGAILPTVEGRTVRQRHSANHHVEGEYMETAVIEVMPLLVPVKQACAMIGRGQSALYELIGGGKIRAVKSDGRTLIVVESLREYAASLPPAKVRPPRNRRPQRMR